VLVLFVIFYRKMFAVTFDETFARATGEKVEAYHLLLACLTALTIVLGMRVMGAMLISSLIIFPALTAMRVCRSFRSVTICAAVVSVVCFMLGLCLSYLLDTPTGASVVVVNVLAFLLFWVIGRARERA
jgi:zinc transport system permease protein